MIFLADLAFAAELIALTMSVGLLIWAYRHDGNCIGFAKFFGYVIVILSIIAILCTSYYFMIYWFQGYFTLPKAHPMLP